MPRWKMVEAWKRQMEPGYVPIWREPGRPAQPRPVKLVPFGERSKYSVKSCSLSMTRQPDIRRAEEAAYRAIITLGTHFPPDPKQMLMRHPYTTVWTYHRAAEVTGMFHIDFNLIFDAEDGFTFRAIDRQGKIVHAVAYRERQSHRRTRFTLAHELGHVFMDHVGCYKADEEEANRFASCLLCPVPAMQDLPLDRDMTRRCDVTIRVVERSRWRRRVSLDAWIDAHVHMWYRWEKFYQMARQEYREEMYERRQAGNLTPYGEKVPPFPDIVWRLDASEMTRVRRCGEKTIAQMLEERHCPFTAECPHAEECRKAPEVPEDRDPLAVMVEEMLRRKAMCPYLKDPLPRNDAVDWEFEYIKEAVWIR